MISFASFPGSACFILQLLIIYVSTTMICWRCHSNSVNTGSRLPICSDVKTRKRGNVVGIDMIRNNRITCLQYATITIIIMLGFLFSSYVLYSDLIHRHVVFSLRQSRRELHAYNTYATITIIIMFKFLCSSYSPHPYLRHRHLLFSLRHSR